MTRHTTPRQTTGVPPARAVLVDDVGLLAADTTHLPAGWTLETVPVLPTGPDVAALAVSPDTATVRARDLDRMPGLRLLAATSAGTDHLDVAEATRRGIRVTSTRDYCTEEVADHTLALITGLLRQTHRLDRTVRGGWWQVGFPAPGRIAGSVLGLWGFGATGRAVAARARALGMRVLVHARSRTAVPDTAVEHVSWRDLLGSCDVLSLHVPLTGDTRNGVDAAGFAAMRQGSFLVNTARGGLVCESALDGALRGGQLAGAAVDVLATEPPPPDHVLADTPGLVRTPHAAWVSDQSVQRPVRRFADALRELG